MDSGVGDDREMEDILSCFAFAGINIVFLTGFTLEDGRCRRSFCFALKNGSVVK